jgi:hypothetical protein
MRRVERVHRKGLRLHPTRCVAPGCHADATVRDGVTGDTRCPQHSRVSKDAATRAIAAFLQHETPDAETAWASYTASTDAQRAQAVPTDAACFVWAYVRYTVLLQHASQRPALQRAIASVRTALRAAQHVRTARAPTGGRSTTRS